MTQEKEQSMNKLVLNTSTSLSAPEDVLDATEFAGANYWKGADIDRPYEVTITSAAREEFKNKDGGSERKIVLGTSEGRRLVMSPTRNKQAMRVWGKTDARAWVGERAVIFPSTTLFAGDIVAAVGFEPIPSSAKLAAPEQHKVIEHDGPPAPPTADEYDDDPNLLPEGVVDDDSTV
jgi:hypothetical protein